MLSFEVRNQGPSHSSFPLSQIKDDRFESTNWVCVLLGRIIIKRSAHSRLILLLLPSDWSGMRSFQERAFPSPSKSPGQTYYLARKGLRQVAKARSVVGQGKQVLSGSTALSTNRRVRSAHITRKDPAVFEKWGDEPGTSHGLFQFETN